MPGWPGRPALDLVVTLDDATGDLLGLPGRGGGHRVELPRPGRGDRAAGAVLRALHRPRRPLLPHAGGRRQGLQDQPTQVGRALAQLGIEHIAAYSPQARGRSERAFRTLQDRLPKELALAGITTVAAANRFLREVYLPAHNARFAVPAEQPGTAFVPAAPELWRDVLCLQETRQVGNDNSVRWQGRSAADPAEPAAAPLRARTVRLHEYPDGAVALFWGPHRLADFPPAADAAAMTWPRDRLDAARPWMWTTLPRCPQPHRHHNSGQSCATYAGQLDALATARPD